MSIIKLSNNGVKNATAFGSITGLGDLVFISRSTASSSSSLSITSGISSTYKEYIFMFNNIHPASASNFTFNLSADSGSNYNVTKTTSVFYYYHQESGSDAGGGYVTSLDLAQSTAYQPLGNIEADNDTSLSGVLHLFEPSSTTFVKHFVSRVNVVYPATTDYTSDYYIAGYGNTTSAIDAIDFKMASGNIDSGTIDMYGVS
jgi:hypothetical protein